MRARDERKLPPLDVPPAGGSGHPAHRAASTRNSKRNAVGIRGCVRMRPVDDDKPAGQYRPGVIKSG